MFKIETKLMVDGREIPFDQFGEVVTKAAIENVKEQVRERLENVVCPEHGQHVSVTVISGQSLDKLNFEIGGCCQKSIDLATAAIS